jgi:hypothetical protein
MEEFTIRDYQGNRTRIELDLTYVDTITLGDDFGDQTLRILYKDGHKQYIHAGSYDDLGRHTLDVYSNNQLHTPTDLTYLDDLN